jgi:hypothetical protein
VSEPGALGYVDDVGGIFTRYNEYSDDREGIGGDLAEIGPAEMARQFAEAEDFFRGFLSVAEHVSYAVFILTGEALDRACLARKAAERHAEPK